MEYWLLEFIGWRHRFPHSRLLYVNQILGFVHTERMRHRQQVAFTSTDGKHQKNLSHSLSQSFSVNRLRENRLEGVYCICDRLVFALNDRWMIAHLKREVHTVHSHDRISSLRFVHIASSLCRGDANYVRTLREHNLNLTNHFSVVTSIMFSAEDSRTHQV